MPPPLALPPATNRGYGGVQYRECLKNYAASMGGHVVDGCGEFMPSGDEGTLDALKCAACNCHRNFHRKEIDGESPAWPLAPSCNYPYHNNNNPSGNRRTAPVILPPPQPIFQHRHHKYPHGSPVGAIPPVMVAFGGSTATESSSEDHGAFRSNAMAAEAAGMSAQPPYKKKRFRTKFCPAQKERMMEFAEKMEWKIQKGDEEKVQEFCTEVGVKRHVFKVWMHNNKQAMKKKQSS